MEETLLQQCLAFNKELRSAEHSAAPTQTPDCGAWCPEVVYPLHRMYPPRKVLHVHAVVELVGTWCRLCREVRNCLLFC